MRYLSSAVALGTVVVLLLTACSGGGGGGSGPLPTALLIAINSEGTLDALWQYPGVTPPACVGGIPLNGRIFFEFNGAVDPASVPPAGPADGAVRISLPGGVSPAVGAFSIEDQPALPPGNRRRLAFTPVPPGDPGDPASGGYASPASYEIEVAGPGSGGAVIGVGGSPLAAGALTCFETCLVPAGAAASVCLEDPVPGSPFIIETWPPMAFLPPPPIAAEALEAGSPLNPVATTDDTVTLRISEPLLPGDIGLATVRLVNEASGAQVPGQVIFFQAGTAEAGPDTARIDYVATAPLLPGVIYQLEIDPLVRDFGDNALQQIQGVPPAHLRLETQARPFCAQPALSESFDDDAMLASMTRPVVLEWGGGSLQATYPIEVFGDGSFGALTFTPGSHVLDTGVPPSPGYAEGVWNTTGITVEAGAVVRVVGPYPAHLRSQGNVAIGGMVAGQAGMPGGVGAEPQTGSPDQGINNPFGTEVVHGGGGGPGAGRGGNASQSGWFRTDRGERGFGPSIGGAPDPGAVPGPGYGGGEGGLGGSLLVTGSDVGGLGGAGGSAWEAGGAGVPEQGGGSLCAPFPTSVPLAQPSGIPLTFVPPIWQLSAGSGGGGGGDYFEAPSTALLDEQGGGGGGGGGGLRISALGHVDISSTAALDLRGAPGATGALYAGFGGSGSGGQLWVQCSGILDIHPLALLSVQGGPDNQFCLLGHGGAGGAGLIQLEDQDGIVNTNFSGNPGGANITVLPFPIGANVTAETTSKFLDTGYGDPRYTAATAASDPAVSLGNAPGATLDVHYEGAHESLTDPGAPDLGTLSAPVTGNAIAQLDGYRFVRFRVVISYTAPPASTTNDIYPAVQGISIDYEAPLGCP